MGRQPLLNISVDCLKMEQALERIEVFISAKLPSYVVPVNTDVIVQAEKDPELKEIVDRADLVLVDGQPLVWVSKLFRHPVPEKISGSDLVPLLCKNASQKGQSIFILGGKSNVTQGAKKNLERQFPGIRIVGTYSPPLGFENDDEELKRIDALISDVRPDLLIVCFGCPKQEKWVYAHYWKCGAAVSICAGATVDFLAGSVKRAPKWISKSGLEWLYRFCQEPKRLFKRYFVEDMKILKLMIKYRGGVTPRLNSFFASFQNEICAA